MRLRAIAAVVVVAAAVRIAWFALVSTTACLAINHDPLSDMESFHRWATEISEGDWLGLRDFHPYHPWQASIAPESVWREWYGPRVFHQEPLFPYVAAAIYRVAPRDPSSVIAFQALLGVLTAAGVAFLGARLAGETAGLIAGLIAAVYGPMLFYESLMLRDALLAALTVAFLLCLEEARRRDGWAWWSACGAAAGLIALTKSSIVLFLPVLGLLVWFGGLAKRRTAALAALLGSFLLVLLPVVARNLYVGAPALKMTTRGAIELVNGNSPYHGGIGWFDADDPRTMAYAREILTRTRLRLLPTIGLVLETWRGRLPALLLLQAKKLAYLFAPYEMPDNASYAYFRMNVPMMRWAVPSFFALSPLAAVGLVASFRRRRAFLPHHLYLLTSVLSTIAFFVVARYRIPLLPLAFVLAGAGAAAAIDWTRRRRWAPLAASALLAAGVWIVNARASYPDADQVRPQDYLVASEAYAARGDRERAASELDRGRAIFPEFAPLHEAAGAMWERAGRPDLALQAYEGALRADPASAAAAAALPRLRSDASR